MTTDELNEKIKEFLVSKKTGDIVLHISQGAITSYDFKESGRVTTSVPPHKYATALIPT